MKYATTLVMIPMASIGILIGGASLFAGTDSSVVVSSGSVAFLSPTNVAGIEVKGSSNALTAYADIEAGSSLTLHRVEASMPVRSLATGMKMRDEHMRKYIFTTDSGDQPDLRFTSDGTSCPPSGQAKEFACRLSGSMSIRGVSRPVTLNLKVREQGSAWRVAGDTVVKLSDFDIPRPVQFGVKPNDEIEIHLDFTGKQATHVAVAKAVGHEH